jgi:ABC-type sugar transport system permease subunit
MGYASAVATVIFIVTFTFAAIQLAYTRRRRFDT